MKRSLPLCLALLLASCVVSKPPATPGPTPTPTPGYTERTLAFTVRDGSTPIAGCVTGLSLPLSGTFAGTTSPAGYVSWLVRIPNPDPGGGLNARVTILCPGYVTLTDSFVIAAFGNQDITFGGGAALGNQAMLRAGPVALPPPFPFPAEHGFIRTSGKGFIDDSGADWRWRGGTQFTLMAHFLRGEDITPKIVAAKKNGWNVLRVFGRVLGTGWLDYTDYANPENDPQYSTKLGQFFDLLAANGVRVEFVPLTYPANFAVQHAQLQQAYDVASGRWNVFVEGANEPSVNDIPIVDLYVGIDRHGVVSSYGRYDQDCDGIHICTLPMLDYVNFHSDRGSEWVRKVKDALELSDGYGDASNPMQWFGGTHRPTLNDEGMGADEVDQPGRRSAVPSDFAQSFAVTVSYSAGGTFHCTACIRTQPLGPIQQAAADAVLTVWKFIPATAFHGSYTRGGLPDLPVEWSNDSASLRTYAVILGSDAWVTNVRPAPGFGLVPVPGWRLESAIQNGTIAHLVR